MLSSCEGFSTKGLAGIAANCRFGLIQIERFRPYLIELLRGGLICIFKQQFLVFKQYFTHIFIHTYFKKLQIKLLKLFYQTSHQSFCVEDLVFSWKGWRLNLGFVALLFFHFSKNVFWLLVIVTITCFIYYFFLYCRFARTLVNVENLVKTTWVLFILFLGWGGVVHFFFSLLTFK